MKKSRVLLCSAAGAALWLAATSILVTSQARSPGDPWTAHYMWRRYFNTTVNCPNNVTAPEYSCTGIILRATNPQKEPDGAWIPEQKSYLNSGRVSAGGVSFSYIRTDSKFGRLAFQFENGFTLYPASGKYQAPPGKMALRVLCAFALDAATDSRTQAGCGPQPGYQYGVSCQQVGYVTVDKWMALYNFYKQLPNNEFAYRIQCGFDMRDGVRQRTDFTTMLQAKQQTNTFSEVNELRIQTWAPDYATAASAGIARELPIESFFYVTGSPNGKAQAQQDQLKFFRLTGLFVPIIAMKMPASPAEDFDFHYNRADQSPGVAIPAFPNTDPLPCTRGNFDTKC